MEARRAGFERGRRELFAAWDDHRRRAEAQRAGVADPGAEAELVVEHRWTPTPITSVRRSRPTIAKTERWWLRRGRPGWFSRSGWRPCGEAPGWWLRASAAHVVGADLEEPALIEVRRSASAIELVFAGHLEADAAIEAARAIERDSGGPYRTA